MGLIVRQARELGLDILMGGGDGWDSQRLAEIAQVENLNRCCFSSPYSAEDTSSINQAFVAAYQKEYKERPDVFAALAYDLTKFFLKALEEAGSADPQKVAEALSKTKEMACVSGTMTFGADHNPIKLAVIIE